MEEHAKTIADLLERVLSGDTSLKEKRRVLLDVAVLETVDEYGELVWFRDLLAQVLARKACEPTALPDDFIREANGFANLLWEVDECIAPTAFENWGEGMHWPFPDFGLRLVVNMESAPPQYALRPHDEPVSDWLKGDLSGKQYWKDE